MHDCASIDFACGLLVLTGSWRVCAVCCIGHMMYRAVFSPFASSTWHHEAFQRSVMDDALERLHEAQAWQFGVGILRRSRG